MRHIVSPEQGTEYSLNSLPGAVVLLDKLITRIQQQMGASCNKSEPLERQRNLINDASPPGAARPAPAEAAKPSKLSRAKTITISNFEDSELQNDLDSVDAQMGRKCSAANSLKCRALIPERDGSGSIAYARSTVKGSRKPNEDNHGAILLDNYAFLLENMYWSGV